MRDGNSIGQESVQGLAKAICRGALGPWTREDLAILDRAEDGRLQIDLLTGQLALDETPNTALQMGWSLRGWFQDQIRSSGVRRKDVTTADLLVRFTTREVANEEHEGPHASSRFLVLECSGRIEAYGRDYVARDHGEFMLD